MKVNDWLAAATGHLKQAGVSTARLDALVLLEDATQKDRAWLLAHHNFRLQGRTLSALNKRVERRANHEPLAYIRGKSEFYGREFIVNAHTLEPRPESETMIELLKQALEDRRWKMEDGLGLAKVRPPQVLDVGTGSGCLAVTAKLEFPEATVMGTDIDKECIKIARQNAKLLGADIKFYQGNLLEPVSLLLTPYSLLLCNLPYVPDSHTINKAAMFEPKHAIFGGNDGLDYYRQLFQQIMALPQKQKPCFILIEALPFQHNTLKKVAKTANYKLQKTEDFIQFFKQL